MRRPRAVRALATTLLVLLTGAACTSKHVDSTRPVYGGTLHVAVRDLSTLDPAKASGRGSIFVLEQIFRPLTKIDAAGEPQPAAASSWSVSANSLTWTFHLAQGTFSDGTPVTAASFVEAFNRIALKATGSDTAFQLEQVKGFHAVKVAGTAKTLSGLSAPNASTLVITLDHPFAELPRFLAEPALGPISHQSLSSSTFGDAPVGNGPFKVAVSRSTGGVTLQRFDGYGGQRAYVDAVDVEVRPDDDAVWTDLTTGRIDVGEAPASRVSDARRMFGAAGFTPYWAAFYYGFNVRLGKYVRSDVRRAISYAIDRSALAQTVYGGTKDPATGILPTGIPGARTDPCDACTFDRSKARSVIATVFKGKAPSIRIDHLDAAPSLDLAQAVGQELRDAGFSVSLQSYTSDQYKKLLASGKEDFAELGWFSDVPSPDPFLAQQLRTGSPNNPLGFSDKTFDGDIDRARAERDETKRVADYAAAQDRAIGLMPLVPLVFFRNRIVARSAVHGFRLDGAGLFDASTVWLAR